MSAIAAVAAVLSTPSASAATAPAVAGPVGSVAGFPDLLARGLDRIAAKLDTADAMVRRLALGDDLPIHQVSYALEEARLSVELAMQVRGRLLDGYREMMNLQL